MSQVAPIFRKDRKERIEQVFYELLASIRTVDEAEVFVNDFFTATEKINLPKRLGVYILHAKGNEYLDIKDMLRVSLPTIWKVKSQIVKDGMKGLEKFVKKILRENKPKQQAVLLRSRYSPPPKESERYPHRDLPY